MITRAELLLTLAALTASILTGVLGVLSAAAGEPAPSAGLVTGAVVAGWVALRVLGPYRDAS